MKSIIVMMMACVSMMTRNTVSGFTSLSTNKSNLSFLPKSKAPPTALSMSDKGGGGGGSTEKARGKKRGLSTITKDRTELKSEEDKKPEEMWRVILHNDEINTFQYAVIAICKTIGTIDRKKAFDMCVVTHAEGKCTLTKSYKDQAMKYCLGLQRNGLTASIAPDSKFDGGGEPEAGGQE
uniref:Adaptor protein ClpS core domain-containing protein n=1 Tax=Ditylum brightwellii TaxID=49249 RepID=A0A6U3WCL6_9STRA|mmetsp:Transcript_18522/g.27625  ORF Transcript_18522/g.27625 Transcript_18522/m.27625 type:complete len:180 (+) Transcript_18522:107-646(+)